MADWQVSPGDGKPEDLADAQIIRAVGLVPEGHQEYWKGPAGLVPWEHVALYAVEVDEDGAPYCSAEGLQAWAEYVCWDNDEGGKQAGSRVQFVDRASWQPVGGCSFLVGLPETHRKPGDPAESLMRVWRDHG